jgi:hypothetical protein
MYSINKLHLQLKLNVDFFTTDFNFHIHRLSNQPQDSFKVAFRLGGEFWRSLMFVAMYRHSISSPPARTGVSIKTLKSP